MHHNHDVLPFGFDERKQEIREDELGVAGCGGGGRIGGVEGGVGSVGRREGEGLKGREEGAVG